MRYRPRRKQNRLARVAKMRQGQMLAHDIQNHFVVMRVLLGRDETEALGEYLDKLAASVPAVSRCGSPVVDAAIDAARQRAKETGVRLSCRFAQPPRCRAAGHELASVLMNILDNALAACRQLPAGRRWVELRFARRGGYGVFLCRNPARRPKPGGQGLGLFIVKSIAKKNGGFAETRYAGGIFTVAVALPLG